MRKLMYTSMSILALAICLALPVTASAGPPTDYVKGILDKVMTIQGNPSMQGEAHKTARAQAIRAIIKDSFDFSLMAREALGPTYNSISGGQRQQFEDVFSRLFQNSYTRLVLNFLKQENINYLKEAPGSGKARVKTEIVRPNEKIGVEYLLRSQGGRWAMYDVLVDGVSILDNYKRQFSRVVQAESFGGLLQKMKTQVQIVE